MPDPIPNNPGTPAPEPKEPPAPPANPPASSNGNPGTTTDWETSYKGLQGTYNKLHTDHVALQDKYDKLVVENEKNKQEVIRITGELGTAQSGLQTKDQELSKHKTDLETKASEYQRLKLIAAKFPALLVMEEQGLIPAMKLDELEPKLLAINESILKTMDSKARAALQAAPVGTPPSSTNNIPPVESPDEIYNKLQKLAGSKIPEEQAEYQRLYGLYMQLLNKPKE